MQVASKFTHGISYFVFNVESIGSMSWHIYLRLVDLFNGK